MGDFFDLNDDGKLDLGEELMKNEYNRQVVDENLGFTQPSGSTHAERLVNMIFWTAVIIGVLWLFGSCAA